MADTSPPNRFIQDVMCAIDANEHQQFFLRGMTSTIPRGDYIPRGILRFLAYLATVSCQKLKKYYSEVSKNGFLDLKLPKASSRHGLNTARAIPEPLAGWNGPKSAKTTVSGVSCHRILPETQKILFGSVQQWFSRRQIAQSFVSPRLKHRQSNSRAASGLKSAKTTRNYSYFHFKTLWRPITREKQGIWRHIIELRRKIAQRFVWARLERRPSNPWTAIGQKWPKLHVFSF